MKKLFLFLLVAGCILNGIAQPNYYTFQKHAVAYAELSDDTIVSPAHFGTGDLFAFQLAGETFSFFGKNYVIDDTSVFISFSNSGHIQLEDDSSFIIIDGIFTYLDSIDVNTRLSYKVEGNMGNKVLKVQWKNLKLRAGPGGNYINVQMWMHQSTGIVDILYGPSSMNNQSGYNNSTGPNVGMFYSRKDFSKMFEKIWINGQPGTYTIDSARTVVFSAMHGVPANGTMYRFIPKSAVSVARQEEATTFFTISPNPSNDNFTISHKTRLRGSIVVAILDITGRIIQSYEMNSQHLTIDTRGFSQGEYIISIKNPEGEYTTKLLIQH